MRHAQHEARHATVPTRSSQDKTATCLHTHSLSSVRVALHLRCGCQAILWFIFLKGLRISVLPQRFVVSHRSCALHWLSTNWTMRVSWKVSRASRLRSSGSEALRRLRSWLRVLLLGVALVLYAQVVQYQVLGCFLFFSIYLPSFPSLSLSRLVSFLSWS